MTLILGIDTSCDDTSTAIVKDGETILASKVFSQVNFHQKYGGVVPEIASRKHLDLMPDAIEEVLKEAELSFSDLNAIAVTSGPGLIVALLVGISTAKAIAYSLDIPLIAVNHIAAHNYANFLTPSRPEFPHISLVVSGGHTLLLYFENHIQYSIIGSTLDDAAGEAFDKVAKMFDLGYPGGPIISKIAENGNPDAINFPRPLIKSDQLDFSFSGLKTAVKRLKESSADRLKIEDIMASFQSAVVEVLVEKTIKAAEKYSCKTISISGGVAANDKLREEFLKACLLKSYSLYLPPKNLCTDNAAMVAGIGYQLFIQQKFAGWELDAFSTILDARI